MVIMLEYHVAGERTDDNRYVASNSRAAQLELTGSSEGPLLSPVDLLLLVAIIGCNIVTTEPRTAQRGHRLPRLTISATSEKIERNKLGPVTVAYSVTFPQTDPEAERMFREVAERVEERHCTVSRSLREGTSALLNLNDVFAVTATVPAGWHGPALTRTLMRPGPMVAFTPRYRAVSLRHRAARWTRRANSAYSWVPAAYGRPSGGPM